MNTSTVSLSVTIPPAENSPVYPSSATFSDPIALAAQTGSAVAIILSLGIFLRALALLIKVSRE